MNAQYAWTIDTPKNCTPARWQLRNKIGLDYGHEMQRRSAARRHGATRRSTLGNWDSLLSYTNFGPGCLNHRRSCNDAVIAAQGRRGKTGRSDWPEHSHRVRREFRDMSSRRTEARDNAPLTNPTATSFQHRPRATQKNADWAQTGARRSQPWTPSYVSAARSFIPSIRCCSRRRHAVALLLQVIAAAICAETTTAKQRNAL